MINKDEFYDPFCIHVSGCKDDDFDVLVPDCGDDNFDVIVPEIKDAFAEYKRDKQEVNDDERLYGFS